MNPTAWTAPRDRLVAELARARAERDAAVARMLAATSELAARKAARHDRTREAVERYRQECEREALVWTAEAHRLLESGEVPADPFAPAHRKTLIDALTKEQP